MKSLKKVLYFIGTQGCQDPEGVVPAMLQFTSAASVSVSGSLLVDACCGTWSTCFYFMRRKQRQGQSNISLGQDCWYHCLGCVILLFEM